MVVYELLLLLLWLPKSLVLVVVLPNQLVRLR